MRLKLSFILFDSSEHTETHKGCQQYFYYVKRLAPVNFHLMFFHVAAQSDTNCLKCQIKVKRLLEKLLQVQIIPLKSKQTPTGQKDKSNVI